MDRNSSPASSAHGAASGLWKTFAASTVVIAIGVAGLLHATAKGNAFTTETLRRTEVARNPMHVPDLQVRDAAGQATSLRRLLTQGDRVWIVDFVYTRCQTVCVTLGSVFQHLQQEIAQRGLQDRVGLLSVSFDPHNDTAQALTNYQNRLRMDPAIWRVVSLEVPQDRRRLLDDFGIMVIPAPLGEYEHNAALHVVTAQGLLIRILDYSKPNEALAIASALPR